MGTQSHAPEPTAADLTPPPPESTKREELQARLDDLIRLLSSEDGASLPGTMHNRAWRDGVDPFGVDSGQLAYADTLVDEAHSILRRLPDRRALAIEQLHRARERLA
jgi:hypothetical protein